MDHTDLTDENATKTVIVSELCRSDGIKKGLQSFETLYCSCDRDRIQTYNLLIRSQMLYSIELRSQYLYQSIFVSALNLPDSCRGALFN